MPERPADASFVSDVSRREFIAATSLAVAAGTLTAGETDNQNLTIVPDPGVPCTTIQVTVNGAKHTLAVEDRWTLAEMLRDRLDLVGTRLGCDRGECGACTVLMDGKPVYACSQLAAWADGKSIQTVEGLMKNGQLHPLQQSFMDHDAPQCGFCTSGQLMSAKALLASDPHPTAEDVRAALTGNICRCSNYNRYVEAVLAVAQGK